MFREMRKKNQSLEKEKCEEILNKCTNGTLALLTDDDYTYAVPLSYVYNEGKIYFHGSKKGQRIDAVKSHSKVSFSVVEQDIVVPEKYTTYFRSVIVFGTAKLIEEKSEKIAALNALIKKYSPNYVKYTQEEIEKLIDNVGIVCLSVEHMTGKEALELAEKSR